MNRFLPTLFLMSLASAAHGEIYSWKDSQGTAHYTNQPDTIPLRYRSRVKIIATPGDQKADKEPAQAGQSSSPAASLPMPPPPPAAAVPQATTGQREKVRRERRHRSSDD